MRYLTEHGLDAARLSSAGFGETRPIADNNTDEGRAQNRRVEFHLNDLPEVVPEGQVPAEPAPEGTTPPAEVPF